MGHGSVNTPTAPIAPPLTNLRLWLREDTGLYQDTAGTVPAVLDGDPVALWQDQSGNGLHATQATGTKCPLLRLTQAGARNALQFDGVDDWLRCTTLTDLLGDFAFYIVFKWNGGTTSLNRIADKSYSGGFWFGTGTPAAVDRVEAGIEQAGSPFGQIFTATNYKTQYHVAGNRRSGTTQAVYADSQADTTQVVSGAAMNAEKLRFGVDNLEVSNFAAVYIGEVLLYNAAHDIPTRNMVNNYLNGRWNLF